MSQRVIRTKKTIEWLNTILPEHEYNFCGMSPEVAFEVYRWMVGKCEYVHNTPGGFDLLECKPTCYNNTSVDGFWGKGYRADLARRFRYAVLYSRPTAAQKEWRGRCGIGLDRKTVVPIRYEEDRSWKSPDLANMLHYLFAMGGETLTMQYNPYHEGADTVLSNVLYALPKGYVMATWYGYRREFDRVPLFEDNAPNNQGWRMDWTQDEGELFYDFIRRVYDGLPRLVRDPKEKR